MMGRFAYKLGPSYLQRRVEYEGRSLYPESGSGESTKDRLAKDGVLGKRPIGAIPRTSHGIPEDKNTTCCHITNSLQSQPKNHGRLLASEVVLRESRGQDNSKSLLSIDKWMS